MLLLYRMYILYITSADGMGSRLVSPSRPNEVTWLRARRGCQPLRLPLKVLFEVFRGSCPALVSSWPFRLDLARHRQTGARFCGLYRSRAFAGSGASRDASVDHSIREGG